MEQTENLKLYKATLQDVISKSVELVFAQNFDSIDTAIADKVSKPVQLEAEGDINGLDNGLYYIKSNTANAPFTGTGLLVQCSPYGGVVFQIAIHDFTTGIYQRVYVQGKWNEWKSIVEITGGSFSDLKTAAKSDYVSAINEILSKLTTHTSAKTNPHGVTKSQVGLGNVTNESKATMFKSPTFTGTAKVSSGTDYTTAKLRNIVLWTSGTTPPTTSNGDILIKTF